MTSPNPGQSSVDRDEFATLDVLNVDGRALKMHRIDRIASARLPYTLKIVLENLLRHQDGGPETAAQVAALAGWTGRPDGLATVELRPSRVFLHDTNGVPALVDLAAMRDAVLALGMSPALVNPLIPAELVVDHSVIADVFASPDAVERNVELEYRRNSERYRFLRWGQQALQQFSVVPPGTGIMHQINIEYLARVVTEHEGWAFPDVCLGTDSHTTMVNGLGVLGWGIGGIEAEAAMLGQSVSMLLPPVVGVRLRGALTEGATATDLVLTITEVLRAQGVIGKFVEFTGPGVSALPVTDRVTISNMSPEFGSTGAIFPIDAETMRYLRFTGRPETSLALIQAYAQAQGLWHDPLLEPLYTETVDIDLGAVVPSLAGPRRPQDRVPLDQAQEMFRGVLPSTLPTADPGVSPGQAPVRGSVVEIAGQTHRIGHGAVAIAAITSCTNTSNPAVMIAAGLLAQRAVERGLQVKPWVKTTLSPGSRVVMDYFAVAGLTGYLEQLGFSLTGFGCMTCIGASGPLIEEVSAVVARDQLAVAAVLSGNRNFEGRIQPEVRMNYLASPPLVVAYALAGSMDADLLNDPLGDDQTGRPVYLRDLWPTSAEIASVVEASIDPTMFTRAYADVFTGDTRWQSLDVGRSETFSWDENSTYVRRPPYLDRMSATPARVADITGARALVKLGDSITTDHISPAGAITPNSPAGQYLQELGVARNQLNTYASRRGNHLVMMRGAFANVRLRNQLAPGTEGGITLNFLENNVAASIYDTAMAYREAGVPAIVLAGRDYGGGSSRDWAAKGPALLGVRAILATSFERIHRSNLIGMGILPLEFLPGQDADSLGLTGKEFFDLHGLAPMNDGHVPETITARTGAATFELRVRLDTLRELDYYRNGGVMPYVLRTMIHEAR
jgi:aconitate hydratase